MNVFVSKGYFCNFKTLGQTRTKVYYTYHHMVTFNNWYSYGVNDYFFAFQNQQIGTILGFRSIQKDSVIFITPLQNTENYPRVVQSRNYDGILCLVMC